MIELAGKIDHTLLKPIISQKEVEQLCDEAVQFGFASVCVPPYFASAAISKLKNTEIKVCSVAGFPYGYDPIHSKAECVKALALAGVDEVDVVINLAAIENREWSYLKNELNVLSTCAHMHGCKIKAIIEAALFSYDQLKSVCDLCIEFEFDFVKTSTGINAPGATVEMVELLKQIIGNRSKLKASGGIRTYDQAISLIQAGADRLGMSSSVSVVNKIKE